VYAVAVDQRGGRTRLLASTDSEHWGPSVTWSDDLGRTWEEGDRAPVAFPADTDAALRRVWQIRPGPASDPDVVWAGTEPAALFRSVDGGQTYALVRPLWDHPTRPEWMAGFGGQALHTVLPHPDDHARVLTATSTAGVFVTDDGGASWRPSNSGIRAEFMPEEQQYPEWGQCVHKVDFSPLDPEQLFLQNHGGVYHSVDGGTSWAEIHTGLPATFGFTVVAHPTKPGTAWVVPLVSAGERFSPEGHLRVYRTDDAGGSWHTSGDGLPDGFWSVVLRDAFCADGGDPLGLYLGTRTGEVWASGDEGRSWQQAVGHLSDILSVRATVLS
jgi:photosystem II stability/assembly factor-like uncharacterized protein